MTRQEKAIRNENIRAYVREGHTRKEAADKYGVAEKTAEVICAGLGVCVEQVYRNQYTFGDYDTESHVREMIAERTPDFEYVGNYTGADGSVDIKCRTCGTITTRSMISIRHRNVSCQVCRQREAEERKRLKQIKEDREQVRKEFKKAVVKYSDQSFHFCKRCGAVIYNQTKRVYCSDRCLNRAMNSVRKDKRLKRYRSQEHDCIDIKILYERDQGKCHICGGSCDWNDYEMINDYFIAGNYYPSIDHLTPISLGGAHKWNNVKLAHRICNTKRGNTAPIGVFSAKAL